MKKPRVLVIDDGVDYARIVAEQMPEFELLRPVRNGAARLADGPAALKYLSKSRERVDVVLLDMQFNVDEADLLPLGDGIGLRRTRRFQGVAILRALRELYPDLPVVLLTAVEDLSLVDVDGELAAQSLTYFLDRDDLSTLRIRINAALQEAAQDLEEEGILWGSDRNVQSLRRRLSVLARGGLPVILEGETGTGKSYLAERFIHNNSGRAGPFVVLDLSTVPRDLVPAHLFGAVRGAYTGAVSDRKGVFEVAHRGTLFIDEIQNVPLEVQKQLLLVLQDRRVRPVGASHEIEVDVKVVAGSNEPLDLAVSAGTFRQDLYMRLGPATRARIPPLRERGADLSFFAHRFVERAAADPDNADLRTEVARAVGLPSDAPLILNVGRHSGTPPSDDDDGLRLALPAPAFRLLQEHRWPGNMRELAMVMHNIVTFTLVAAVDAIHSGLSVSSPRLQVDTGLVGELLRSVHGTSSGTDRGESEDSDENTSIGERTGLFRVRVEPNQTLNAVTTDVERQYYRALFNQTRGDFGEMAKRLLGDEAKGRAVRLRFNQIGLKVRELRS